MRLWASIKMTRPRLPFATFGFYGWKERHLGPGLRVQIAGTLRTGGYDGSEDEKPHRGVRGQHSDSHADCPAPGDPQGEGGGSLPPHMDRLLRGAGHRDEDLRQQ